MRSYESAYVTSSMTNNSQAATGDGAYADGAYADGGGGTDGFDARVRLGDKGDVSTGSTDA